MTDTSYDNLVVAVSGYKIGFQPKKPEQTPDFPFELKVHITRGEGNAQAFAELIGKRLSSDRRKFVYQDRRRVKPENATFVERRENLIKKGINHLTRTEVRHWKTPLSSVKQASFPTSLSHSFSKTESSSSWWWR